ESKQLSQGRLEALRNVARLASSVAQRIRESGLQEEMAENTSAVNQVLEAVGGATSAAEAARVALDTVRSAFGWAYGSYWQLNESEKALRFSVESGAVNEEFRRVTLEAS